MAGKEQRTFSAPKGMRDYYPPDMLRRRFIEKAWRDTSIRHGFEEIDGPTFEHTDLYTVKSGEGIVSEIFGVFSGKDEEQVKAAGSGQAPFALRPEFTPTLARMYAAKAGSLSKPTKWFWQQNCFRAERPQRGRLREFLQWNVDFIGGDETPEGKAAADAEVIGCAVEMFRSLGLTPRELRVEVGHRMVLNEVLRTAEVSAENVDAAVRLIDAREKTEAGAFKARMSELTPHAERLIQMLDALRAAGREGTGVAALHSVSVELSGTLAALEGALKANGLTEWCQFNFGIARGLAYYTGMVFEVLAAGERAIAGGGRYDNLIETFGGPPTPAVGFGLGDVVLSNILQDRGLMLEGGALMERLSEPGASYRPDVFVLSNGTEEAEAQVRPLVAALRRGSAANVGSESRPTQALHARHSYKSTKNIGKLLKDASDCFSRFAAIIESPGEVTLKNLDSREEFKNVPMAEVGTRVSVRG